MTTTTETIKFEFELDVEHELEVDQDGILTVSCFAYTPEDDDDDAKVVVVPFRTLVENAIEYSREDLSADGFGDMYKMGHALREASEEFLKAAEQQENYVTGQGQIPLFEGAEDDV